MRNRVEIPIIAWDKRIDPFEVDTLILRLKVPPNMPSSVPSNAKLFVEWDEEHRPAGEKLLAFAKSLIREVSGG